MAKTIGRNRNTSDSTAVEDGLTAGDVATNLAETQVGRIYAAVSVRGEPGWVREIDELVDPAVRKGVFMPAGSTYEFPVDSIYTGPISVINDKNGKSPVFYLTERT